MNTGGPDGLICEAIIETYKKRDGNWNMTVVMERADAGSLRMRRGSGTSSVTFVSIEDIQAGAKAKLALGMAKAWLSIVAGQAQKLKEVL